MRQSTVLVSVVIVIITRGRMVNAIKDIRIFVSVGTNAPLSTLEPWYESRIVGQPDNQYVPPSRTTHG